MTQVQHSINRTTVEMSPKSLVTRMYQFPFSTNDELDELLNMLTKFTSPKTISLSPLSSLFSMVSSEN